MNFVIFFFHFFRFHFTHAYTHPRTHTPIQTHFKWMSSIHINFVVFLAYLNYFICYASVYPPSHTSGCTIFSLIYRHELVLWWYFNGYSRMVGLVKYILYLPQDHFYFYFFATGTSRICRKTRLLNASFTAILNFHYQLRTVCGARLSATAPLTTTHIPISSHKSPIPHCNDNDYHQ